MVLRGRNEKKTAQDAGFNTADAREIRVNRLSHIVMWPLAPRLSPRPPKYIPYTHDGGGLIEEIIEAACTQLKASGEWEPVSDPLLQAGNRHVSETEREAFKKGWIEKETQKPLEAKEGGRERKSRPLSPDEASSLRQNAEIATDQHFSTTETGMEYGEFVYFHDFVQQTMFPPKLAYCEDAARPVRVFRRKNVTACSVVLKQGDDEVQFRAAVPRLTLYLYASGAIIVCAELDYGLKPDVLVHTKGRKSAVKRRMTLADAQTLTDRVRRVYAPYFTGDGDAIHRSAADVPVAFSWQDMPAWPDWPARSNITNLADAKHPGVNPYWLGSAREMIEKPDATGNVNAPLFGHWSAILDPLFFSGNVYQAEPAQWPLWRHVVDERLPVMTCLSVTDGLPQNASRGLHGIRRSDWTRLCYADAAGDGYFYNRKFMDGFEQSACYDRYYPDDENSTGEGSRFMFSGYHFAAVGAGWFFDNMIVNHFRRHYFHLALAAHVELVSLLVTSGSLSEAVRHHRNARIGKSGKRLEDAKLAFETSIINIKRRFLEHVHLFRFTGLSNQLQPNEMQAMWRASLRLDEIYKDVEDELENATQFVFANQQARQADASAKLNIIATIGLMLSLVVGFLGMNILIDPDESNGRLPFWWVGELWQLGSALIIASTFTYIVSRLISHREGVSRQLTAGLTGVGIAGAILILAGMVFG